MNNKLLAVFLLLLWKGQLRTVAYPCNTTLEAISGMTKQVSSPLINYEDIGSNLHCWYTIRAKSAPLDVSISLDFDRFNIGELEGNSCIDGYLQVLDSRISKVNDNLGFYCGQISQPQLIIRQTDIIKLIFQSNNVSRYSEWRFSIRLLQKSDLPERFGSHPEYFPGRVGAVVEGTYCETVFQECREQNCFVQSPGFPGVYPRGVTCRYYLSTKSPLIRMYIEGLYWDAFNVDARRCENFLECEMRQLSDQCPFDYVSIYDGMDEYSPLIGRFCGSGIFPQSIIGTSNRMFVEFVSSRYGSLLNTGFDFRITSLPSSEQLLTNSTCHQEIQSTQLNGKDEGTLLSLEHWYTPGTNCTYLLKGTPTQVVRLYFVKMKIQEKDKIHRQEGACTEYLALYDSNRTDPNKIMKVFCDAIPQSEDKVYYVSTGPYLLVNFISYTGSYSGSSIYYWGVFDFHGTDTDGHKVEGTECDEEFTLTAGKIQSPKNTLIFLNPTKDVTCKYIIKARPLNYGRISVLLEFTKFAPTNQECRDCPSRQTDYLQVLDHKQELTGKAGPLCYSACSNRNSSLEIISSSDSLTIKMHIGKTNSMSNYFKKKWSIFQARYTFIHPAVCGPTRISGTHPGFLSFPDWKAASIVEENIYCIWDIVVKPSTNISFQFGNITLRREDCLEHSVSLSSPTEKEYHKECGQTGRGVKLITIPGRENTGLLKLTVKMKSLKLGRFQLQWEY